MVSCEAIVVEWLLWVCPLLSSMGYAVVFFVNLIGSASIFIPVPGFALLIFMPSMGFNPWLLAIYAALGAAVGELTGYAVGVGGRKVADKSRKEGLKEKLFGERTLVEKAEQWSKKRGVFPVIILFAATPLPFDIIGIVAGVIRYNAKKFLLATFIGKLIIFSVIAWAGLYGMDWLLQTLAGGV